MNKVDQTIVDKGYGNCMQAVLASLFEKQLDDTINVMDYDEQEWIIPFIDWIESVGYDYYGVVNFEGVNDIKEHESVKGFWYGVVPSKNFDDVTHAVIIDEKGVVVHDPNPDKKWQGVNVMESGDLIYWYVFKKVR